MEVTKMLDLYKNIRKFRKEKKMSQQRLAELTGYTDRSSIARIEKGEIDLPQSKIFLFANALGVDAGTLYGNSEEWSDDIILDKDTKELVRLYVKLNSSHKAFIKGQIVGLLQGEEYKKGIEETAV